MVKDGAYLSFIIFLSMLKAYKPYAREIYCILKTAYLALAIVSMFPSM